MRVLLGPSIARRLTLTLLLACLLVWCAIYVQGMYMVHKSGSGNFDSEILTLAQALTQTIDHGVPTESRDIAQRLIGITATLDAEIKLSGSPAGFLAFQVHTSDGTLVGRGGQGPSALPRHHAHGEFFDPVVDGQAYRAYRQWSQDKRYRIDVTQSVQSRQQIFNAVMLSQDGLLNPLLIGFPLLLLPLLLAVYTGLSPLRRLSRELASRKPSDLRPLKVRHVYSELAPVVSELNSTMARLSTLLQRERDFLADAAHELRTPLALISAQCDTLLHTQDSAMREGAARRLQGGVERASRLVNQLLSLARLDADLEDTLVTTDVADVVRDCLAAYAQEARSRDIELSYAGPDSLLALCPGHAVESVVNNLVSNAVRYGQAGGHVEVLVSLQPNSAIKLTVLDDGKGIAPEDRGRLFERFRRGNDVTANGSGLGLAIVASAARQLSARIKMSTGTGGGGLCVSLTWPHLPVHDLRPEKHLGKPKDAPT